MDPFPAHICEKENMQYTDSIKPDSLHCPSTPMRTPLQDVDHNLIKPSYSQITPVSAKTPRRTSRMESSLLVYEDKPDPDKENIPINSLVYKKVMELVSKAHEEYEEKLSRKDQVIDNLRHQLSGTTATASVRVIPPTPVTDDDTSSPESVDFCSGNQDCTSTFPKIDLSLIYKDVASSTIFLSPNYKPSVYTKRRTAESPVLSHTNKAVTNNENIVFDDGSTSSEVHSDESENCREKFEVVDFVKNEIYSNSKQNSENVHGFQNQLLDSTIIDHNYSVKPTVPCTASSGVKDCRMDNTRSSEKGEVCPRPTQTDSEPSNTEGSSTQHVAIHVTCSPIDTQEVDPTSSDSRISSVDMATEACLVTTSKSDFGLQHRPCMTDAVCSPFPTVSESSVITKDFPVQSCDANTETEQYDVADKEIDVKPESQSSHTMTEEVHIETNGTSMTPIKVCTSHTMTEKPQLETQASGTTPVQMATGQTMTDVPQMEACETSMTPLQVCTSHTMTDRPDIETRETSMTPVNVHNKFGKRLTAEEVRRQHPRALANELDTLSVSASRLKATVGNLEKEREHLRCQVRNLKKDVHKKEESLNHIEEEKEGEKKDIMSKCEALETRLLEEETLRRAGEQNSEQWKTRCSQLEKEMGDLLEAHQREIVDVREELERHDYRPKFEQSQRLVQELQAEVAEFADLADNLERAEKLQEEVRAGLSTYFTRMSDTQSHFLAVSSGLEAKQAAILQQRKQNMAMAEKLKMEKEQLLEENSDVKRTMELCQQNIVQLEALYNSTSADLLSATTQVCLLNKELTGYKKAYVEADSSKKDLTDRLKDADDNDRAAFLEIQSLRASLAIQDRELEKATKKFVELQNLFQEQQKELKKNQQEYDAVTVNMQRTLESREQDIEIQEKDLYECRELIIEQRDKIDLLEPMAAEHATLKIQSTELQKTKEELQESLRMTEEELSVTKEHASRLILQQGAEIRDCSMAVQDLGGRMDYILSMLRNKVGLQNRKEDTESKTIKVEDCQNSMEKTNKNSLVSQVLAAAERESDSSKLLSDVDDQTSTAAIESPGTISRRQLGFSTTSAFVPVKSRTVPITDESSRSTLSPAESTASKAVSSQSCEEEEDTSETGDQTLSDQIYFMCDKLKEIIRMANILEQASRLSIQDLKVDNDSIACQADHSLQAQRQLHAELEIKKKQLEEAEENIGEMRCRMEAMSDNLARFSDQDSKIRVLEDETQQLKIQVTTLESDKILLNSHLEEIIQRRDEEQTDDVRVMKATYERDILALKKKIQKLRDHLWEKEEHYEAVGNKASKRMEILKENWQKAEAEVHRLDSLIEVIRESIVSSKEEETKPGTFQKLLNMIDGVESASTKHRGKENTPLQVIQTARW